MKNSPPFERITWRAYCVNQLTAISCAHFKEGLGKQRRRAPRVGKHVVIARQLFAGEEIFSLCEYRIKRSRRRFSALNYLTINDFDSRVNSVINGKLLATFRSRTSS
jgi:hypothetical protein